MPLYEYRCKQCGHTFEKIQSFSAPEEKECPVCHGEVERLISAPAIQFKGAGWYVNDYARKGAKAAATAADSGVKSDKAATTSSDGTGKSSSDSTSSAVTGSGSSSGAVTSAGKSD